MPPISDYERDLIEILFDVGPVVAMPMGGHQPISESDIGWYRLNRRAILTTHECAAIKQLSAVYAGGLAHGHQKDASAPYRPAEIDHERVAEGFMAWAENLKAMQKG